MLSAGMQHHDTGQRAKITASVSLIQSSIDHVRHACSVTDVNGRSLQLPLATAHPAMSMQGQPVGTDG